MLFDMQPNSGKILIIDGDPLNVNLLRVILEDVGYQVDMLVKGDELLNKIIAKKPDVIILDMSTSDINGYEICQNIRQSSVLADLPVIMITAVASPEDRLRAFDVGATAFINKPFDKKELLIRVRSNLACQEAKKQYMTMTKFPKAIIFASPDWAILCLSKYAAALLKIQHDDMIGKNLLAILHEYGLTEPMDESSPSLLTLNTQSPYFQGEHNPVKDSSGQLVLRVLVLSEIFPQVMEQ